MNKTPLKKADRKTIIDMIKSWNRTLPSKPIGVLSGLQEHRTCSTICFNCGKPKTKCTIDVGNQYVRYTIQLCDAPCQAMFLFSVGLA